MVYKYIELVGSSRKSFADAVQEAVKEAAKTVRGISWVRVIELDASVKSNRVSEFHATVRIAFQIER